jgi:hypothetical protein
MFLDGISDAVATIASAGAKRLRRNRGRLVWRSPGEAAKMPR